MFASSQIGTKVTLKTIEVHRSEPERAQCLAGAAEHRQKRLTKCRERDRAGSSVLIATVGIYTNLRFSLFSLQTCGILCVAVLLLVHATPIHGNSLSLPYTLDRSYLPVTSTIVFAMSSPTRSTVDLCHSHCHAYNFTFHAERWHIISI